MIGKLVNGALVEAPKKLLSQTPPRNCLNPKWDLKMWWMITTPCMMRRKNILSLHMKNKKIKSFVITKSSPLRRWRSD